MRILHICIERWAGRTNYVNYGMGGAFEVAHAYTLIVITASLQHFIMM